MAETVWFIVSFINKEFLKGDKKKQGLHLWKEKRSTKYISFT